MSLIPNNLYKEVMAEFKRNGFGKIAQSFERQKAAIIPWIDYSVNEAGLDITIEFLNDAVEMDQNYDGPLAYFGDINEALRELRENNIERSSREFRSQVNAMGENQGLQRFITGEDGQPIATGENPNLDRTVNEPVSPLQFALEHNQRSLARAELYKEEDDIRRFTRNIELIEKQIEREPEIARPQLKSAPGDHPDTEIETDSADTAAYDVDEIEHRVEDDIDTLHEGGDRAGTMGKFGLSTKPTSEMSRAEAIEQLAAINEILGDDDD